MGVHFLDCSAWFNVVNVVGPSVSRGLSSARTFLSKHSISHTVVWVKRTARFCFSLAADLKIWFSEDLSSASCTCLLLNPLPLYLKWDFFLNLLLYWTYKFIIWIFLLFIVLFYTCCMFLLIVFFSQKFPEELVCQTNTSFATYTTSVSSYNLLMAHRSFKTCKVQTNCPLNLKG